MTIYYDFETVTETRVDEDGNEYQTEKRGPLKVWFSKSNPDNDPADQTYDWRSDNAQLTWAQDRYPIEIKSVCAEREINGELSGNQPFNKYVFEIYRDLMTEQIERV